MPTCATRSEGTPATARSDAGCPLLNGLIHHSFALQLSEAHRPFRGSVNSQRIAERFDTDGFRAQPIGDLVKFPNHAHGDHSPLANSGLTTLESFRPTYVGPKHLSRNYPLPPALAWAAGPGVDQFDEPKLVFADLYDDERSPSVNDFLVSNAAAPASQEPVSQALLELMAHKRSRLFGFRLANRFVNVMLPHAILSRRGARSPCADEEGSWFLQPFVSFVRGGRDRRRLRSTYSLTIFLVPVRAGGQLFTSRPSPSCEITQMVNAGWGFAAAPPRDRPLRFGVSGPLLTYLSRLARFDLHDMSRQTPRAAHERTGERVPGAGLTLRQTVEKVAFGVGLSMAQGRAGRATKRTMDLIGNDVVMSLGSARVSSAIVIDPKLSPEDVKRSARYGRLPASLGSLMEDLAAPVRVELWGDAKGHELRLDRPFVDGDRYAIGLLPTRRCLATVSRAGAQYGVRESALMQAGSIAYMTIGAATAIGTMRQIDRRLEHLEGAANPRKIAEIDAEIASDLGEIYDLDITHESYRGVYRLLRDQLGITRDYETLQNKMQALYQATSTVHEDKAQRLLAWLTGGIVALSLLILIGTVVLAGKG